MAKVSKIYPLCVMMVLICCSGGCKQKEATDEHDVAHQLFIKSVRMIKTYIDSVRTAPDSASLQSILSNFNLKLTALNYEFPPDTDLDLNEEENDSLIRMHKLFVRERLKRDSILSSPNLGDSIHIPLLPDSVHASKSGYVKNK